MLRALREVNVPKFLKDDIPLFDAIVRDLFPGIDLPTPSYDILMKGIERHCMLNNLMLDEKQLGKIMQFCGVPKISKKIEKNNVRKISNKL